MWGKIGKKKDISQSNNAAVIINKINTAIKWSSQNGLIRLCCCLIIEVYCHWWGQGKI